MESEIVFHLIYILFVICLLYPPSEFVSAGFTINNIFSKFLGDESIQFIQYHIRRTILTIIIHSLIPAGYFFIYKMKFMDEEDFDTPLKILSWQILLFLSCLLPVMCGVAIFIWSQNNWEKHPICKLLKRYSNNNENTRWDTIAEDVNAEFRRDDKLVLQTSSIFTVVATENWILKSTPYTLYLAHQSDTALIADKADSHVIGQDTSEDVQFVNIQVKPTRTGVVSFSIRINVLHFQDLQDRTRPIVVLSGVQFRRSTMERWIEVFKQEIDKNPRYLIQPDQISDSCFACMILEPNIKIAKNCEDVNFNGEIVPEVDRCRNCYCRPMWCTDCLAKWFASRQNEYSKEVWLEQKCTCPMCRAPFCILDVCYVEKINVED